MSTQDVEPEVSQEAMAAVAGLFSPEHIQDPYPTYAKLRDLEPVLFLEPAI